MPWLFSKTCQSPEWLGRLLKTTIPETLAKPLPSQVRPIVLPPAPNIHDFAAQHMVCGCVSAILCLCLSALPNNSAHWISHLKHVNSCASVVVFKSGTFRKHVFRICPILGCASPEQKSLTFSRCHGKAIGFQQLKGQRSQQRPAMTSSFAGGGEAWGVGFSWVFRSPALVPEPCARRSSTASGPGSQHPGPTAWTGLWVSRKPGVVQMSTQVPTAFWTQTLDLPEKAVNGLRLALFGAEALIGLQNQQLGGPLILRTTGVNPNVSTCDMWLCTTSGNWSGEHVFAFPVVLNPPLQTNSMLLAKVKKTPPSLYIQLTQFLNQ